jgi:hypothetical protein
MAGSLLSLGGWFNVGDPSQYFVSAAANATTGGSPLFDPGAVGKYLVVGGTSASIPYTGGLAKNGTRVFQLVKLDPAATATFGAALIWKDYSDYLVTTVGSNTAQNSVAGLLISGSITAAGAVTSKTIDSTNGNYILMAVEGVFPYLHENGTASLAGGQGLIYAGVTTAGRFMSNVAAVVTAVTPVTVGTSITAKAAAHQGITTTGDYVHGNFRFPKLVSF